MQQRQLVCTKYIQNNRIPSTLIRGTISIRIGPASYLRTLVQRRLVYPTTLMARVNLSCLSWHARVQVHANANRWYGALQLLSAALIFRSQEDPPKRNLFFSYNPWERASFQQILKPKHETYQSPNPLALQDSTQSVQLPQRSWPRAWMAANARSPRLAAATEPAANHSD